MNFVRGRAEARWLPSRHNFAIFRLFAYLRLRNAKRETSDVILFIDRHQSASETWIVGVWLIATLAGYLAATWLGSWPLPLAMVVAFPLAWLGSEVPAVATGIVMTLVTRNENHVRINSFIVMLLYTLAALGFAKSDTWVRFVAWQFLAMLALNAVAAAIVYLLRGSIARLEASVSAP